MLLDVYLGLGDVSLAREAHSNEMGLHLENEISFIASDGCESPFSRSLPVFNPGDLFLPFRFSFGLGWFSPAAKQRA